MRGNSGFGLAQRIVLLLGLGAALVALGAYLDTLGYDNVHFGWFAYAPLNSSITTFKPQPTWLHLLIWVGVVIVWALVALWLIGSALGRRIVLVLTLAAVFLALGQYFVALANNDRPGLQFLSTEQRAQLGSNAAPAAQFAIWAGLAIVWTLASLLLMRGAIRPSDPETVAAPDPPER